MSTLLINKDINSPKVVHTEEALIFDFNETLSVISSN